MGFAVEMYLDSAAEERVRSVWRSLRAAGLDSTMLDRGTRPHLSLAGIESVDMGLLCALIEEFAVSVVGCRSEFAAVGTFPGDEGVVFLAPVVSRELLALHRTFHERLGQLGQRSWEDYLPGRWVPHCTVGLGLAGSSLSEAIGLCRNSTALGPFEVAELGLIRFPPVTTVCAHGAG